MNNTEEIEEIHNEDIANTYEQLTKVVNAKNDIKRGISLNAEEHARNEHKEAELEEILHDVRIKITSNPVLKELNTISEDNALDQRKLAEGIYSELPDLSSRSDMYEEKFSKFSGEYNLVEELHSNVAKKFEETLNKMSSLRKEKENKVKLLKKTVEEECEKLRAEITKLTENISREKNATKCLMSERESKLILLKKMNEGNSDTLFEPGTYIGMKKNEITSLQVKKVSLDTEITELIEKQTKLFAKINELKQQITFHQISIRKLLEQIDIEKSFSKKKKYLTSINELKSKMNSRRQELAILKENIVKEQNTLTEKHSKSEICKSQITEISDEIQTHLQTREQLVEEKTKIYETNIVLEGKIENLKEKLRNISKDKNELEFSNNVNDEKQKLILQEVDKVKEKNAATELVIGQLNDQISKIQTEISVKEKVVETPSFEELEKENEILNIKIRRYIKAIEIWKQNRVAAMRKERNDSKFSDSSDDSMLLPNRRR